MHKNQEYFCLQSCQTPIGWIRDISDGAHLIHLGWNQVGWKDPYHPDDVSRETINQLTAYFARRLMPPMSKIPYPLFALVTGWYVEVARLDIILRAVCSR